MFIDWNAMATIASPVIALFIGAGLNRFLENRPKVVSYLGHVSGIFLSKADHPIQVNTHSVVLRNAGRKMETNIRLGHNELPDYQIFPDIEHAVKELPGGEKEIVIPKLIPKKQITITYLYFHPLTWEKINTYVESDGGAIKVLNVLPTVQLPKWLLRSMWLLIAYGIFGLSYTFYEAYKWLAY
jgi:hypothetical protein